jgi:class 3 adenylate cyclase
MADIELVMDAAGSQRAVIVGLSEGGPLACLFAATRPGRVESLVLIGTFARGSIIGRDVVARFDHAIEHWGEGHTAGIFLTGSDGPVARRFISLFERAAASPGTARRLLASIVACDVTGVLESIDVPALVIHRRDDPFARASWSDELEGLLRSVTRVELDGSDHLPWMGDGTSVVREIATFVTGRPLSAPPSRARFAAVLFTDIVGSTRQLAEHGDVEWAHRIQAHNDLCRNEFERHGGWAIKSTGDGFLACFDTPERAVQCAFSIQRELAEHGIEVRSGMHCGEIESVDVDDVVGIAVNIAARLCGIAGPGVVLATKVLSDQLVGAGVHGVDQDTHELRGVPGRVAVFRLVEGDVDFTVDLRDTEDVRASGGVILELARRSPGLVRGLARLAGAR